MSNENGVVDESKLNPCDICLYDKTNDKLIIVKTSEFSSSVYPSSAYSPVGVVVIPASHDIYGDGSCTVISIKPMSCDTPDTGGTSEDAMSWGDYDTEISTLPNLDQTPYIGIGSNVGDSTSTVVGQFGFTYLPSDKFTKVQCPHDTDTYYFIGDSPYYDYHQAPSPFLTDGSRNPAYYQTRSPSSTSNRLADFDGVGNTDKIIAQRGVKNYSSWKPTYDTETDYPAASCCNMYYTDGTSQGDWYLPACGELGYIMPNFNKINTAINTLADAYGVGVQLDSSYYYWASSEGTINYARSVGTGDGYVRNYTKSASNYVRAFLRVK